MQKIVGVKFKDGGKVYYFAPNAKDDYQKNAGVVVETAKGIEYATVVYPSLEVEDKDVVAPLKPIIRIATQKDEEQKERNIARRPQALKICQEKIEKHKLDMKLIDCEFTFDGTKVIFYFTSDGRVDFRELVKDLASVFHLRIELRQVGIRDETKMLGGIAPCGRVCCCASCMPDFRKVSIKMAKTQGLSLNPSKISGLCGRLMCCLEYENDYYAEAGKKMPKIGAEADSPDGKGTVIAVNMLKMEVKMKIPVGSGDFVYREFPVEKIKVKKNACGGCNNANCKNAKNGKTASEEDDEIPEELKNME